VIASDTAAAFSTTPTDDMINFPPMPNDDPPGASAPAIDTARALGRGVNFGNMLEAPREGDWGLTVQDGFFAAAKAAGFKTIRLPVRWSNHAGVTAPYALDAAFAARVDAVVGEALAAGFRVVLDMHHYRQLDGDKLNSGEATVEPGLVDLRFLHLWDQIAARYRDKSEKLVFELYNEPHGRLTSDKWNDLAARALSVVRKSNPTRPVIIGPIEWNNATALQSLRVPNDANVIVTIHNYQPFAFTHQGAEWTRDRWPTGVKCCSAAQLRDITGPLDIARAWSDAKRYPIYLGEFGAYHKADMASRVSFSRTMREEAEKRAMSWAYWEFAAGFGVYDPKAKTWHEELKRALLGE
jgi:endoglucanase